MSYDDLLPWRALAQQIPKDVLNPTHRLIIITLMTYESTDKGAFFTPENIASELGLSYRSVLDNFHYLGAGLVWKDKKLVPCLNPECKSHLKIIKTTYYAKRKRSQTYRLDQRAIKDLVSVHLGAPIDLSMNPTAKKGAIEDVIGCAPVHPHKHNKHLINVDRHDRFNDLILKNVPRELRSTIKKGQNLETLLDSLEVLGVSPEIIRGRINMIRWSDGVNSAGGIVVLALTALIEERKQAIARSDAETEKGIKLDLETQAAIRNKASREQIEQHAQEARKKFGERERPQD